MYTYDEYERRLSMKQVLRVSDIELGTPVLVTEEREETPRQSVWLITGIEEYALILIPKRIHEVESLRVGYMLPFGWVILMPDPFTRRDCFNQSDPPLQIEVYE